MAVLYALSDIHGFYDELLSTLKWVDLNSDPQNKLIFLGDYVNRGKKSCDVLYKIKELEETYPGQVIVLLGNHDITFIEWLTNTMEYFLWAPMDIHQYTIRSFFTPEELKDLKQQAVQKSLTEPEIYNLYSHAIRQKHPALIKWLQRKWREKRYYETDTQIFVHAGIDEGCGDFWKHITEDYVFTEKYPAETGSFYKDIIAGHISSATVAEDEHYSGKVYWDGKSHFYIDGDTPKSRKIPLLKYHVETKVYSSFETFADGTTREYIITLK